MMVVSTEILDLLQPKNILTMFKAFCHYFFQVFLGSSGALA